MIKSNRSLQISVRNMLVSKEYSEKIKEVIQKTYYEGKLNNLNNDEIFEEILKIKRDPCDICGYVRTIGEKTCPNILPHSNVLPEKPNDFQLKHYWFWRKMNQNGIDSRDNAYIVERNKTAIMRKAAKANGLKFGIENIKNAHEKYDKKIPCNECNDNSCNCRNFFPLNSFILGIGCLTKYNNSKTMKESTINRNIKNWKNPEYANKIASNLGNYLGKANFIEENNCCEIHKECNLKYFDRKIDGYICWECYRQSFLLNSYNNQFYNIIKKYYSKSFMFSTFRSQDSIDWNRAKAAFEQSLVDNDVNWFVYIKFYIDERNNIKPLVVGKSGSLNVNGSGSDVSFSMNINDGPARRFLNENGFQWDKTQILIISCEDEENAYNIENKIALEYQLFQS